MFINLLKYRCKSMIRISFLIILLLSCFGSSFTIYANSSAPAEKKTDSKNRYNSVSDLNTAKTNMENGKTKGVTGYPEPDNYYNSYTANDKAANTEESNLKKSDTQKADSSKNNVNDLNDKTAYLTFDDGPSSNTPRILKILKDYSVKATFFVNGNENMKEAYKNIIDDGHVIGNHTYSHDYKKIYKSTDDFINDVEKLNKLLEEVAAWKTNIYRFPGGSHNKAGVKYGGKEIMDKIKLAMGEKGYRYFDWNVTSADTDPGPMGKIAGVLTKNVLDGCKNKKTAIILMHDRNDRNSTVEALPDIINGLMQQGFIFKALSTEVSN